MKELEPKELFDIWTQGKSIVDAIDAFLNCALIKKQVQKRLKELKDKESETQTKKITGFQAEREKLKQKVGDFSEYETELLKKLYEEIRSEQLLAIGYREPIGASDFPVLIPLKFWPPQDISLETSSVKFLEAGYSAVRIAENPKREIDFSVYDSEPPPAGRNPAGVGFLYVADRPTADVQVSPQRVFFGLNWKINKRGKKPRFHLRSLS